MTEAMLVRIASIPAAPPQPAPAPSPAVIPDHWLAIAACESGDRANGTPIVGTHRWDYGITFSHGDIYEGAFNFHPNTWDSYRDPDMPGHAGNASPRNQLEVAERVLAAQGWGAWPACSRLVGLR